jgi:hypothetical protein
MKTTKAILSVALFVASLAIAKATPVTMTYSDANALFGALTKVQAGLTPENVEKAAQDIWVLEGPAKAFGKAQIAGAQASERAKSAKDPEAAQEAAQSAWTAFTDAEITLDLQPLNLPLTPDEIKDTKITPDVYAPILHFLSAPKK